MLRAAAPDVRFNVVRLRVIDYLQRLSQNRGRLQLVPPFLADELQERFQWEVVPAGVEQVLARARALRAALDSATVPAPVAPPQTLPADSGETSVTP